MRIGWLLALAVLLTNPAFGEAPSIRSQPFTRPPTLDGVIQSGEWANAAQFSGLVDIETAVPAPEGAEFWLASDGRYIYFAARLGDRQPALIRKDEYRTNVSLQGNDTVSLTIDPFGNLTDFNTFTMNPRGATNVQIAGGRAAKREWLGEFQAVGRVTENGWEVEARIPWEIMRLPAAGERDVRFNVNRNHRRYLRQFTHAYTFGGRVENTAFWRQVEVPPSNPRTLLALPYFYAGAEEGAGRIANAGVDLRTSITDQIEAVGAINPDFRNIENQVLSLDFSYFERLAGESRPFFLEGQDFFRTSRDSPIFASQRISQFDIGAKAFGKITEQLEFGVMNTTTIQEENAFVSRMRYAFEPRERASFAYVRSDIPGLDNESVFAEYSKGIGAFSFYGQYAHTNDQVNGSGHRIDTGFSYNAPSHQANVAYLQISEDYLPRLGFAPERDLRGFAGDYRFRQQSQSSPWIREYGWSIDANYFRRMDGSHYRQGIDIGGTVETRDDTDVDVFASYEHFEEFHDYGVGFSVKRPDSDPYRNWEVRYTYGRREDMPYQNIRLGFAYRPVQTLQMGLSLQQVQASGDWQQQSILSATYDLGRDQSLATRIVWRRDEVNAYLAFRRSGNRGAEYYLILGDPNAESFTMSLILKAVFPLSFRI